MPTRSLIHREHGLNLTHLNLWRPESIDPATKPHSRPSFSFLLLRRGLPLTAWITAAAPTGPPAFGFAAFQRIIFRKQKGVFLKYESDHAPLWLKMFLRFPGFLFQRFSLVMLPDAPPGQKVAPILYLCSLLCCSNITQVILHPSASPINCDPLEGRC